MSSAQRTGVSAFLKAEEVRAKSKSAGGDALMRVLESLSGGPMAMSELVSATGLDLKSLLETLRDLDKQHLVKQGAKTTITEEGRKTLAALKAL
jgi:DNA-binding HxlR family transcriptional regulator